jgi:hypothetical protein
MRELLFSSSSSSHIYGRACKAFFPRCLSICPLRHVRPPQTAVTHQPLFPVYCIIVAYCTLFKNTVHLATITVSRPALEPTLPATYPVSTGGKRSGREANHSPPSSVEFKNAWSYTSTSAYVCVACVLENTVVRIFGTKWEK